MVLVCLVLSESRHSQESAYRNGIPKVYSCLRVVASYGGVRAIFVLLALMTVL